MWWTSVAFTVRAEAAVLCPPPKGAHAPGNHAEGRVTNPPAPAMSAGVRVYTLTLRADPVVGGQRVRPLRAWPADVPPRPGSRRVVCERSCDTCVVRFGP